MSLHWRTAGSSKFMNWKVPSTSWRSSFQRSPLLKVGFTNANFIPDRVPGEVGRRALPHASGPFAKFIQAVIRPYGTAVVLVAVAFVLTLVLRRVIPYPFPFLFFAAVMASAWFG